MWCSTGSQYSALHDATVSSWTWELNALSLSSSPEAPLSGIPEGD